MDAIIATLGVQVLGYEIKCHFHYAQCINNRANSLHLRNVRTESAAVGTFFQRLQNAIVYATTSCWAIKCIEVIEDSKGFHSKIRASYPTGTPFPDEILRFCAVKLTMAKTFGISFGNGSLKDRCIRPDYKARQPRYNGLFFN
uniref:Transposase n=1 Tax=Heterorhabditis bacteriophora TaxID=37862 RepID=A0A1I7W8W2_HETBA